jgi:SAM-dependent methyltransferase
MNVSSNERLPFDDRFFDFVVCSHTLEDIRDPVFLCSELNRVGRRGYLETPSMLAELAFGVESRVYAGYYHHRWLVEMNSTAAQVVFLMKPHFIHGSWQYHIPKRMCRRLTPQERVTWLFWEGAFSHEERVELDMTAFKRLILDFVRRHDAYPEWRYATIPFADRLGQARNLVGTHARRAFRSPRRTVSGRL